MPSSPPHLPRRRRRSPARGHVAVALAALGLLSGAAPSPAAGRTPAVLWTVAGNGVRCAGAPLCADGIPAAAAQLGFPEGDALDGAGDLLVADWGDNEVRRVTPSGAISVVAGDGVPCPGAPNCGDGGPSPAGQLNFPEGVAADAAGDVLIADTGDNEIRKVSPRGVVTRVAGDGAACSRAPACGDGGSALRATLDAPGGVAVDRTGNVFIADTGDNEIRKVSPRGTITRVAGTGTPCATAPSCGDGGAATAAQLNLPQSLALDSAGRLYVVDDGENEVRRIAGVTITRFAGTGAPCAAAPACGDGHAATAAQLNLPEGVAAGPGGTILIADWGDDEIRAVSRAGTMSTIAGNGRSCPALAACGNGISGLSAPLAAPQGVAADGAGNVYIADTEDQAIRLLTPAGLAPASVRTAGARVELLGLGAAVSRARVAVRFVTSAPCTVTLTVHGPGGRSAVAARSGVHSGLGQVTWNRRLNGRAAPAGRYTFQLSIAAGRSTASSTVAARL